MKPYAELTYEEKLRRDAIDEIEAAAWRAEESLDRLWRSVESYGHDSQERRRMVRAGEDALRLIRAELERPRS